MSAHPRLKALLIPEEGNIDHFYLDSNGYPTLGVGHLVPSLAAAQALPLLVRATANPATPDEIAADYAAVKGMPKGLRAEAYRSATKLYLPPASVDTLLESDIATAAHGVTNGFPSFGGYPEGPQTALLDMAFNLGTYGLCHGYPHLKAACEAKNWPTAAKECYRHGIGDARNQQTAQLFLEA